MAVISVQRLLYIFFTVLLANHSQSRSIPVNQESHTKIGSHKAQLPCLQSKRCHRMFGTRPEDVALFGNIAPCPFYGFVRCITPLIKKKHEAALIESSTNTSTITRSTNADRPQIYKQNYTTSASIAINIGGKHTSKIDAKSQSITNGITPSDTDARIVTPSQPLPLEPFPNLFPDRA